MVWDWIEPKTLPVVRLITARVDPRWYEVVIKPDRVIITERPTGRNRSFYLLHQLEEFCVRLSSRMQRHADQTRPEPPEQAPYREVATELRPGEVAVSWRARWKPRSLATARELRNEVARLHEAVAALRDKRRRAESERDRWERLARELEAELIGLRGPEIGAGRTAALNKFRRVKKAFARLTHPDAGGSSGIEARVRERLFKEFWAEFERIEAEP